MPDYNQYRRPQEIRLEDIPWGSIKKFIPPSLMIFFYYHYRIHVFLYRECE